MLFGMTACSDFLDETPLDTRVDANFFQTQSDFEEAL